MKIMIVGGTGLLGHQAAEVALERGHEVASLAIKDIDLGKWYPEAVKVVEGDCFKMTEDELEKVFEGYDAMIYAVGPDDRVTPREPAYEFFKTRLVDHCAKVFRAARRAGVKKASLCSSYFLYFDKIFPEKKMKEKHAYIRVRYEQAELIKKEATDERNGLAPMDVYIMELPYIFGTIPGREPLWRVSFLDHYVNGWKWIFFPKGETVMTTTRRIGESLVGSLEYGTAGKHYPIGDENHSYDFMLNNLLIGIQGKPRKIVHPSRCMCAMGAGMIAKKDKKNGLYHGLDYKYVMKDIMTYKFNYPQELIDEVTTELHMGKIEEGALEKAIIETGKACYPDPKEFK